MATEVGSDIALIQDEDMLRKMWQQTEDFGKKKEIRMRMYKLREQRLKEFYTTGEMIQTETTSKRSSTRTHTESITDQGFMAMKTKEIRDSQSPTEDYHRQSSNNKNYYVSSKNEESDGNRGIVQTELISSTNPSEEFTQSSLQTSKSSSTSSKWESSQTIISVTEEVQKSDINLSSKFIANEQNNEDHQIKHDISINQHNSSNTDRQLGYDTSFNQQNSSNTGHQLTYETSINQQNISNTDRQVIHDTSLNQQNRSNIDSKISQSITDSNIDNIKQKSDNQYSNDHKQVIETYTSTSNGELFEPASENISNKKSNFVDNLTDISTNKSENIEITTDNKIINELQKLDSYLSTQKSTTDSSSNKSNYSTASNEEKKIKKVGDRTKDSPKEITEDQYTTTYQHSYQQPRISVDLSPSHEAFARSLRSTPERTSPSPSRERTSPERRLKSASPEKYRSSPEKSGSPSKSVKSFARRKLSSTHTKDLSKKRANTPTRNEKYDSSDDSDCSGATHGTYDKYKGYDAKRTLFKEDTKVTSTTKYSQKSPSTSPVRREKSPGYSSEGSVGKEVRKSSFKVKNNSHESSPERSAFKPIKNYRTSQTHHETQNNIVHRVSQNDNVHTNDFKSKNNVNDVRNLVKVISPEVEDDLNESNNTVQTTQDIERTTLDSKNKSIQEKFIIEEQIDTSSKQIDNIKKTKEPINNTDIKKTNREYSPSKNLEETSKFNHEEFIENEKMHVVKEGTVINESVSIKPKEKSPVKEVKPIIKEKSPIKDVKHVSRENSPSKDVKPASKEKSPVKDVKPNLKEKSPVREVKHISRENSPSKDVKLASKEKSPIKEVKHISRGNSPSKDVKLASKEKSPIKEGKSVPKDNIVTRPSIKSPEKISHSPNERFNSPSKKTTSALPSSIKKPMPSSLQKTPSNKSLLHKDSKDNFQHKTVKKDLSREKVDIKITKTDSKTLIHKNSKESVALKSVTKKPSQELLIDKKTTISFRNKVNSPEIKPKTQEPTKVIEKKDSKNKLKPSISPQSSQKKLGVIKSTTDTKNITDYKRGTESSSLRKIPSTSTTKPKIFTSAKPNGNETPSKATKVHSKTISSSVTTKSQIKTTTPLNLKKTIKTEVSTNVETNSKDLENELPPDNFESDTDLDDSTPKRKYVNSNSSNSPSSSSTSSSEDEDEEDRQKIKDLDNIRIEAEEGYGKKMTNKDALLNVIVQLPPSSRESSPEYYTRAGQPYCSVSDDASLPRYADVVSEPEDANDYRLHSNRYDVVTDLDEESNVTVADRVSKFLNNVNKQDDIKTTEIPKSPQAVKKAKQLFESIAKGQIEETDINEYENESEEINNEVHDSLKNNNPQSTLLTRKISGASDYKTRKEFFENGKSNDATVKVAPLTPKKITRTSSIKERRASFETKVDKKTPLKDKTNVPRTKSPESKSSSPDRTAKNSTKINQTEIFDVKVEEINKSRRLSGSRTVKDRKSTFETNEVAQKSTKENKTTSRPQALSSPINTGRVSDRYTKSIDTKASERVSKNIKVTSPIRNNKSPEKTPTVDSINKISESTRTITSKSPDRKTAVIPTKNTAKNPGRTTEDNPRVQDTITSSRQRIITTTTKTDYGVSVKNTSAPKTTTTITKTTSVSNNDDELQIEEIFDLHVLEIMLEKAVGYDRRRRIRAQIRVVKRQQETKSVKETNPKSRFSKNDQNYSLVKSQKQSQVTVEKTEVKKQRSPSPQKQSVPTVSNSRSPSPQKTVRSVEETRSPLPQKSSRPTESTRSPSPQKTSRTFEKTRSPSPQKTTMPVEKIRSPSPQKSTPIEKTRSPSPKKITVAKQQQESRFSKAENSFRNSTMTSSSTIVTTTTKVKSEQVSTGVFQEQNVTDLITSSYGVGPTDDNGRPLFGLRALRKTNNSNQSTSASDSSYNQIDSFDSVSDQKSGRSQFGLKALQGEKNTCTVQESRTVYQKVSEKKGGVDQLITDHKGKPLFGLKALQSIGKNEEEPIYDDMPEPPVSPQLKELVLKHEKHVKESSKLDSQPRQKPKAKFRDSYILDNKDEGLYSTFQQNGFTEPNSITLSSIITNPEDDQSNETIVKSKSQSTVFQSKSVMKSDGCGKVSVTQDFLKGEVSSVNDQRPSGKLTRGHYTYQNPDDSDSNKGVAKITTVTTAIGGKDAGPEITEITEELNSSDRTDGNKVVKRSQINDKFESIQKRFSQESFDQSSRRSSKETNGFEKTEESPHTTPRSSLVRGDSIKALQHKFQQATVSSSLKQNKSTKSDLSSQSKQIEEKTVSTTKINASKSSEATSFLDNSSRVSGVQDVLTRMRNADLIVESGDTDEDHEARALLNKFLGASVILHGMEQGGKSPTSSFSKTATTNSASLVNQVEKQRAQKSPTTRNNLNEQELDNIWDEKQLQILLESCPDYDQRRKIRARLRQIMAEHKACADVVALANTDGKTTANNETNEVTESNSTSVSSKTEGGSYVKTEVHTRTTTSSNRLTKANSVSASPFAKFQQLERQNSAPNSQSRPCYKFTDPALARSASTIKDRLLNWVKAQTKEYKDLQITNFSTSWSDGLAFCALIHHFYPESFDYDKLKPENRRENFELAFRVAEDEAGIAPLLDVEDMVVMRKPDWKCVFTYVQTFYRRFHNVPEAVKPSF